MKYFELDEEEKQILDDFEKGEFRPIKNEKQEIERFRQVAAATLSKSKNINIRLTEKDLLKIKAKAAEMGIPYQTLVSSIIHRFVGK